MTNSDWEQMYHLGITSLFNGWYEILYTKHFFHFKQTHTYTLDYRLEKALYVVFLCWVFLKSSNLSYGECCNASCINVSIMPSITWYFSRSEIIDLKHTRQSDMDTKLLCIVLYEFSVIFWNHSVMLLCEPFQVMLFNEMVHSKAK